MNAIFSFAKTFTFVITLIVAFALSTVLSTPALAIDYAGGTYINLCGTGTAATAHTCNAGCNTGSGSCSGSYVVKYVCDGRVVDCRNNESGFSTVHSVSGVGCGKTVQIDVFSKNCRDGGGWNCGNGDLKDYIVWYSGDCSSNTQPTPTPQGETCANWQPLNTQFRTAGESSWVDGATMTNRKLTPNSRVDVNCFAKNGTALLKDAVIVMKHPNGTEQQVSSTGELRNYAIPTEGYYQFFCRSTSMSACQDADGLTINAAPPAHQSSCDSLSVVSGQDALVPATLRLRATGTDNKGSIQLYRFFFGDGQQSESSGQEIDHRYETSGTYTARVELKDSQGNWKTSSSCETQVRVKASPVESHRSGCSDLFITEGQDQQAPVTAKFSVTGFDNKGSLQQYKVDFGNGIVKEGSGSSFEQRYESAGTYTVRGYVKDSQGNWKGGDSTCQRTLYVRTAPLTTQPKTGTPTDLTVFGVSSGIVGSVLLLGRKKLSLLKR